MKKPKWLRWDSSDADDDLKKVRRQTDQRIKQQEEAQKEQQDEAEKKNQAPLTLPEIATRGGDINSVNASDRPGEYPSMLLRTIYQDMASLAPFNGASFLRAPLRTEA